MTAPVGNDITKKDISAHFALRQVDLDAQLPSGSDESPPMQNVCKTRVRPLFFGSNCPRIGGCRRNPSTGRESFESIIPTELLDRTRESGS